MLGEVQMSAELLIRGQRSPERYSHAFGGSVERLPEGWVCGRHCDIGGDPGRPVRVGLVLLHPGLGVALLDIGERTEGAEEVFRARLEEARFGAIFGGYLPVLHGCLGPEEMPDVAEITRAFDQVPPLSVSGGSAWMSTVSRLIVPVDRVWADNWAGAANRGAAPRAAEPVRQGNVVPLRRVASVQPPAAEPEDMVLPAEPPPVQPRKPWLVAGGAGVALAAVAAGLWLGSMGRPEPAGRSAPVAAAEAAPAEAVPVVASAPTVAPSLLAAPVAAAAAIAAASVATAPAAPVAQRPLSRPVRLERPVRARPPAKPAQRTVAPRPGRG
jgi:hypothetical protein